MISEEFKELHTVLRMSTRDSLGISFAQFSLSYGRYFNCLCSLGNISWRLEAHRRMLHTSMLFYDPSVVIPNAPVPVGDQ